MYANIIVDISHQKLDKVFQYKIPKEIENGISAGVSVKVPFGKGNRLIDGFVLETTDICDYDDNKIKSIAEINEKNIPVEGTLINLAWFIKNTYGGTMN
ncbi:MAG: primosomal protein N', partial [Lachnospiraceae bacterium]|nr:primosomal protein N' [Lachnospiraceae bacterium]